MEPLLVPGDPPLFPENFGNGIPDRPRGQALALGSFLKRPPAAFSQGLNDLSAVSSQGPLPGRSPRAAAIDDDFAEGVSAHAVGPVKTAHHLAGSEKAGDIGFTV